MTVRKFAHRVHRNASAGLLHLEVLAAPLSQGFIGRCAVVIRNGFLRFPN
jgi:hypothetical protein